jgi:hypothetical protein
MRIVPLSLKEANAFVDKHHRHNKRVVTHKVSIGMESEGKLIGVAIGGNPVARLLDNGKTFEIRRVCVLDGYANACSKLMARIKRIAQLMGYEKVITYTLKSESGSSLKAVNARCVAEVKPSKGWTQRNPHCEHQAVYDEWKYRWELQDESREAA